MEGLEDNTADHHWSYPEGTASPAFLQGRNSKFLRSLVLVFQQNADILEKYVL